MTSELIQNGFLLQMQPVKGAALFTNNSPFNRFVLCLCGTLTTTLLQVFFKAIYVPFWVSSTVCKMSILSSSIPLKISLGAWTLQTNNTWVSGSLLKQIYLGRILSCVFVWFWTSKEWTKPLSKALRKQSSKWDGFESDWFSCTNTFTSGFFCQLNDSGAAEGERPDWPETTNHESWQMDIW